MKILLSALLLLSMSAHAVVEIAELPTQESLQGLLASIEQQPTHYLPHYTENPVEMSIADNHELVTIPDLNTNPLAEMVSESYQDNQNLAAQLKQDGIQDTQNIDSYDITQALAEKYTDCPYCAKQEDFQEEDFKQAATNLAVVADASHQTPSTLSEHSFSIFQGQTHECRKYGFGYLNCCGDSGWGQFVSQCNGEEIALRQAREKGTAIFLGTKKSGSKLKIKKYDVYCVFESKLARIIQAQGRLSQLGVGFGSAQTPDCRGISPHELSSIDFERVNLAEIYPAIAGNLKSLDEKALASQMQQKMVQATSKGDANA